MTDWLRPLLLMFFAPSRGMAEARDRALLGPALLLALLLQVAHALYMQWPQLAASGTPFGALIFVRTAITSASVLLPIAVVFVPLVIFVANLFERRGSFGVVMQQEYGTVASTVFYAWAAASLVAIPLAMLARAGGVEAAAMGAIQEAMRRSAEMQGEPTPEDLRVMWNGMRYSVLMLAISPFCLFMLWALVGVRQVFGFSWWRSVVVVAASGLLTIPAAAVLIMVFGPLLSSPFILLLLFFTLRGYFGEVRRGQHARAAFRQNLEAATLNPADASAHYNLGLIHLHRKELTEARERFERAVGIDAEEVDAHFQLGRIARAEGRLADAIKHFEQVVVRDPSHAQQEIWREIGATYVHAGQFADAEDALERFLDQRQSDPEGLYLMGRAFYGQGHLREAKEWMQRCVEAVRTAPAYKYRTEKRWLNEAQQFLRSQA